MSYREFLDHSIESVERLKLNQLPSVENIQQYYSSDAQSGTDQIRALAKMPDATIAKIENRLQGNICGASSDCAQDLLADLRKLDRDKLASEVARAVIMATSLGPGTQDAIRDVLAESKVWSVSVDATPSLKIDFGGITDQISALALRRHFRERDMELAHSGMLIVAKCDKLLDMLIRQKATVNSTPSLGTVNEITEEMGELSLKLPKITLAVNVYGGSARIVFK